MFQFIPWFNKYECAIAQRLNKIKEIYESTEPLIQSVGAAALLQVTQGSCIVYNFIPYVKKFHDKSWMIKYQGKKT